jgi:hypothetical protein
LAECFRRFGNTHEREGKIVDISHDVQQLLAAQAIDWFAGYA